MNRRSFLTATTVSLATVGMSIGVTGTDENETPEPDDEEMPTETESEAVRGESDATVEKSTEEDDEHVEYLGDGEVQYVKAWRASEEPSEDDDEPPEREPVYTTTDWESWGQMRTRSAASRAAADYVEGELTEIEHVGSAISSRVSDEGTAAVVTVTPTDEDAYTLDEVADVTPRAVDVTYTLDDRSFESEIPIYVRFLWYDEEVDEGDETAAGGTNDDEPGNEDRNHLNDSDSGNETDGAEESDGENEANNTTESDNSDGFGPGFGVGGALTALGLGYLFKRGQEAES